jgi:ATP-dependent exoDNAse (exonuclease V) beta subunit
MKKISYSELKNWNTCPYYHKLVNIDKIKLFKGNEYTAFGNAVHDTCEDMLLNEQHEAPKYFITKYKEALKKLSDDNYDFNKKLVLEMKDQGLDLLPHIKPAVEEYFGEYEVFSTEEQLFEDISHQDCKFKGYVDLVLKTPDGKYHIIDWKTCSWGWNYRKKTDKMITYQLTFYKHFFAKKHNVDLKNIETHFALLKRTAKKNKVEIFKVTSGKKKIQNALNFLSKALYNISNKNYVKNRMSCTHCEFRKSAHCT